MVSLARVDIKNKIAGYFTSKRSLLRNRRALQFETAKPWWTTRKSRKRKRGLP